MQDYVFSSGIRGLQEDLQKIAAGVGEVAAAREDLTDLSNGLADIKTEITDLAAAVRELADAIRVQPRRRRWFRRAEGGR